MIKKNIVSAVLLGLAASVFAEEVAEPSIYDKIWSYADLYSNDDATVLQDLAFTGRLQGDAHNFKSEDTSNDNTDWRRLRLGFKAKVFNDFTVHSEMDLDTNEIDESWNDFYLRLTDSYIAWKPSKTMNLKVGKQSAGFTLDGATSSKKLIVPERSIVAGNIWFGTEYFTGATVYGDVDKFSYKVGGFSSSGEPEFGHFDTGYFALLSAGMKVGESGEIRLDYVYQDPSYDTEYTNVKGKYDTGTKDLRHIGALVYKQMITEKLGLWTDIALAKGIKDATYGVDQSDLFGLDIMPFYNFTDAFQLVAQYAYVTSLGNDSDVSLSRYAAKNDSGDKVETAHNMLLGFNWYIYGHKLKWQNAVEYNHGTNLAGTGEDHNGYGVTSALRISW
jgi:phosphate-selective porin OprO/OprP